MNNLVISNANMSGRQVPAIDARHLHERLGIQTEFSHWIKRRIEDNGFTLNADFIVVKNDDVEITG